MAVSPPPNPREHAREGASPSPPWGGKGIEGLWGASGQPSPSPPWGGKGIEGLWGASGQPSPSPPWGGKGIEGLWGASGQPSPSPPWGGKGIEGLWGASGQPSPSPPWGGKGIEGLWGASGRPRSSVVVPTLGRSPLLAECLEALAGQVGAPSGGPGARPALIVVAQGGWQPGPDLAGLAAGAERWIELPRPVGFAAAVNLGIAASETPYVAVVNDDAVVAPGWLAALEAALDGAPDVAAAQGANLLDDGSGRADGWGLAWNGWLQAVQLGRGEPMPRAAAPAREVFGVSATAALYRRVALDAVAGEPRKMGAVLPPAVAPPPEVFDSRLVTYYEDVDLAWRLRRAGFRALSVPAARARHRGSVTAGTMGSGRWRLVYGNRYLVLAGLLGGRFWGRLPRLVARDLVDLVRAAGRGDLGRCRGVLGGWGRAARHLRGWARRGPSALGDETLLAGREEA